MKLSWFRAPEMPETDVRPHSASASYRLESVLPGASFNAEIQAWWLPADPARANLVFQHLLRQGDAVCRNFSVLDAAAAKDSLNCALAAGFSIPNSNVQVVAARAELSVGQDQLAFAERRAAIDLQVSIEVAEMEAMRTRLFKLRDLFLSDSAVAGLWWSRGEPDRMLRLQEESDKLETIVSLVTASPAVHVQQDKIASLIDRFLDELGPSHRDWLVEQLAKVFQSYEQPELADELLETWHSRMS